MKSRINKIIKDYERAIKKLKCGEELEYRFSRGLCFYLHNIKPGCYKLNKSDLYKRIKKHFSGYLIKCPSNCRSEEEMIEALEIRVKYLKALKNKKSIKPFIELSKRYHRV